MTKSGSLDTFGGRLRAERERLKVKPRELADTAGIPLDSYRKYEGGSAVPGGGALAGLAKAGVRVEWVLVGRESARGGTTVLEEPRSGYAALNLDRLTLVIGAVELLLPGYSPGDRANVVVLAYDYMTAKGSGDREVLADFLRRWARSALAQPAVPNFHSPEVTGSQTDK